MAYSVTRQAANREMAFPGCMLIEISKFNKLDEENAIQQFSARFGSKIQGVVSGFDRVIFRASFRQLNHAHGIEVFLFLNGILLKDYEKCM
jgi:hypothetical protein